MNHVWLDFQKILYKEYPFIRPKFSFGSVFLRAFDEKSLVWKKVEKKFLNI